MDTWHAFMMGEPNRDKPIKVFDWDKAAKILRDSKATYAGAGLSGDWECTGGCILRDGKIVEDDYTYLSSTWATPQLSVDGEVMTCWKWQKGSGWDSGTKWPDSARAIFRGEYAE